MTREQIEAAACKYCNISFSCSREKTIETILACNSGKKRCYISGAEFRQPEIDELVKMFVEALKLIEMAKQNCISIQEIAMKTTTGNVSHNCNTIMGKARRMAGFIDKHWDWDKSNKLLDSINISKNQ